MRRQLTISCLALLFAACDIPVAQEREESEAATEESDPEEENDDPLFNDEDATRPPASFEIHSIDEELVGANFQLRWELAEGVGSYSLLLSQTDSSCSDPYATYSDLKKLRTDLEDLKTGANYACVTAHNHKGETPAANTGLEFMADVDPPVVSGPPVGPDSPHTGIEVLFTWEDISDAGEAGLSHVRLEVKIEGSDELVFNGPIAGRSDHSVLLEESATVYARIKAVDKVENESEWTEWSEPVVVDLD